MMGLFVVFTVAQFRDEPDAPWPVKKGGWVLWLYERSLGSALILLFLFSAVGHAIGGWRAELEHAIEHGSAPPSLSDYVGAATFWFESFQNWQSEFLSIAAMVWLAVYLRQRGSPESKPVHAPHHESEQFLAAAGLLARRSLGEGGRAGGLGLEIILRAA